MENKKKIVMAVAAQICNMWMNNIEVGDCGESFEGWCEDGAVFDKSPMLPQVMNLMKDVAPYVDSISYIMNDKLMGR